MDTVELFTKFTRDGHFYVDVVSHSDAIRGILGVQLPDSVTKAFLADQERAHLDAGRVVITMNRRLWATWVSFADENCFQMTMIDVAQV